VNSKIVVVLSAGAVVEMPWIDACNGLVFAGLSGQAGAGAVIDVITGAVCPSGKLSETYSLAYEDTPIYHYYPGAERTSEYRESLYVGYRYYDTVGVPVRFPFGYGLSYTTFEYSDIICNRDEVSFTLTNTGNVKGTEISQVYIGLQNGKVFRPKKELKAFAKTVLSPKESKRITVKLDGKAFRYFNVKTNQFEIEEGKYDVYIGASSVDIRLSGNVFVEGTDAPEPYDHKLLLDYYSGSITQVKDESFEVLLGRPIPDEKWDRNAPLGLNDTVSQLFYAKSFLARFVYRRIKGLLHTSERKGKANLNLLFIYNIPFRGIAKMMDGAVNIPMVEALLEIVNGHFFKGSGYLISAWRRGRKERRELTKEIGAK